MHTQKKKKLTTKIFREMSAKIITPNSKTKTIHILLQLLLLIRILILLTMMQKSAKIIRRVLGI